MDEKKTTIDKYEDILCGILADRLPLSNTWNNVAFHSVKGEYEIRWFDHKERDDREGEKFFRSHRGPHTLDGLHQEIVNQERKYASDRLSK
jgi:hypothetical protein